MPTAISRKSKAKKHMNTLLLQAGCHSHHPNDSIKAPKETSAAENVPEINDS